MKSLANKIALVTGGSRGLGKGIALSLAKHGATVYITGRTTHNENNANALPGTIFETQNQIISAGGKCIAIKCDHTKDQEVVRVFNKIFADHNQLDILVNNAWGGYEHYSDGTAHWLEEGFWTSPIARWDKMFSSGVRAAYFASSQAVPKMIEKQSGIIINLSFWASKRNDQGVAYCASKAATDKITEAMAHELHQYNIPVICLYPGLVRTEAVLKNKAFFDLSNSESPAFAGEVIVKLVTDPDVMIKSGKILIAASEALSYGIKDIDGSQPRPLTKEDI